MSEGPFEFEIIVLSRAEAEEFECDRPWAAIQIATEEGDWPDLDSCERVGVLRLAFADIDHPAGAPGVPIFTTGDAHEVVDFILELRDRIDILLVHCEMGIHRSAAIAAALARLLRGTGAERVFFDRHEPNPLVYRTLYDVGRRRPELRRHRRERED